MKKSLIGIVLFVVACYAHSAAPENKPWYVNDNEIFSSFREQMEKLIKDGAATKGESLVGQLERSKCRLTLPSATGKKLDPPAIYEKGKNAVVIIGNLYMCGKCTNFHSGQASGFAITNDGVIVTNYHVVEGFKNSEVAAAMTSDGKTYAIKEVLAASKANDIAIVKLDNAKTTPLPLFDGAVPGTPVYALSHPSQRFFVFTEGMLSRYFMYGIDNEKAPRMAITADYAKGSSGAPILGPNGSVVGLVSSTQSIYYNTAENKQENLQMVFKVCIPAHAVLDLINSK